ncbi:hypothetical protein [Mesorhizobium sp. CN2-181]|uniref:hypothetical protein n=1 Tax=Mesorhizobium yinganensis TaxID=3157707 RepID=UPI0032B7708A
MKTARPLRRRPRRENPYTKRPDETGAEYMQRLHKMHEDDTAEAGRIVAAEKERILAETRTRAPRTPYERQVVSIERTRANPMPIRLNCATRRLANHGAMAPEGCLHNTLFDTRYRHDLSAETVKEIMSNLWEFRLLGWFPGDTAYLNYAQVTGIVARKAVRPNDTADLIPAGFAERQSPDELAALRYGREARSESHRRASGV